MRTLLLAALLGLPQVTFGQQEFRMRAPKVAQLNDPVYSTNDVKAEIDFGRGLAGRILKQYPLVENPTLQQYVSTLGAGLAAQIGRPELTFHFAVINTNDVNAYACPGGYIFLTKGLIDLLSNEAELAGVLAHEITHVNERHVIKKLKIKGKDDSALAGLGAMIGGATASFRVAVKVLSDEAMNVLFNEGLMESEELISDQRALLSLVAADYDISAYKDLLEKIKSSMKSRKAQVLSKTHPSAEHRIKLYQKFEKLNKVNGSKKYRERFEQYAKL